MGGGGGGAEKFGKRRKSKREPKSKYWGTGVQRKQETRNKMSSKQAKQLFKKENMWDQNNTAQSYLFIAL